MASLRYAMNMLIYFSVALGALLILQLYFLVPRWLFYSVVTGWVVYLLSAFAAATGHEFAYPIALVLSIVTLFLSQSIMDM